MSLKVKIHNMIPELTAAERRIVTVVLSDFPFSGLGTIQELSDRAQVSAPSITRFVTKIGFAGYQDFQRQLIDDLKKSARAPVDERFAHSPVVSEGFLGGYLNNVQARLSGIQTTVSEEELGALCTLFSDPSRAIYVIGGRVTHGLAHLFAINLQFLRADVHLLPSDPEQWPYQLQHIRKKDVLLIFDFRRYQKSLERFADLAVRGASPQIILVTDQWLSPIAKQASRVVSLPIALGTVWDSYATALALLEALLIMIAQKDWDSTKARIEAWDRMRINPDDPATPVLLDEAPE